MGHSSGGLKALKKSDPVSSWKVCNQLGTGTYGSVNKVIARSDGETAAAKIIYLQHKEDISSFSQELRILSTRKHRCITNFIDGYLRGKELWIIIEICEAGSLADVMDTLECASDANLKGLPLQENELRSASYQLLEGLNFLHSNCIMHRDIKAANVMLKEDGVIKLGDFGVSAILKSRNQKRHTFIGSPNWMAPEVALCETNQKQTYTHKADIWSFGATVIELAQRSPPFSNMHALKILMCVTTGTKPSLNEPELFSQDLRDFLKLAFVSEPEQRADAITMQQHPFLRYSTDQACLSAIATRKLEKDAKARTEKSIRQNARLASIRASLASGRQVIV